MKKMKRFLAMLLSVLMLAGQLPVDAFAATDNSDAGDAAPPQIKLETSLSDDSSTVTAEVKIGPYSKASALQFYLNYDQSKVETSMDDVTLLGLADKLNCTKNVTGGQVRLSGAVSTSSAKTSDEEETILSVDFHVLEEAQGEIGFSLETLVYKGDEGAFNQNDSVFGDSLSSEVAIPDPPAEEGYDITLTEPAGGTAALSAEKTEAGNLVTVTVAPDEGFTMWKVLGSYTDDNGTAQSFTGTKKSDTEYTFIMPEADVTLEVLFAEVSKTRITSLEFAYDKTGAEPHYDYTPEFNKDTREYTVTIPDYQSSIGVRFTTENGDQVQYYPVGGGSITYGTANGQWTSMISSGDRYIKVADDRAKFDGTNGGKEPLVTVYTIRYNKLATIKTLIIDDTLTPEFDRDVTEYTTYIPADQEKITIKATSYTSSNNIEVNGIAGKSGADVEVPVKWDENGTMVIQVKAVKEGQDSVSYNIVVKKEPQEDTPSIVLQPKAGQSYVDTVKKEDIKAISLRASANGTLNYQWYKNTKDSKEGGVLIEGAREASFVPEISTVDKAETYYYYCIVTNTNDEGDYSATSDVVSIDVMPDPTPYNVVLAPSDGSKVPDGGYKYDQGDTIQEMKVTYDSRADLDGDGVTVDYTWWNLNESGTGGGSSGTSNTYTYNNAYNSSKYLKCSVNVKVNGKTYKADSNQILFTVSGTECAKRVFSKQPNSAEYTCGSTVLALSVSAGTIIGDNVTNSYQWYVKEDGKEFEKIEGAIGSSYTPESMDKAGTRYYKCEAAAKLESYNGKTYTSSSFSEVAKITFKTLSEILGEDAWDGEGTEENPYLLKTMDDLMTLREVVNVKGISLQGSYLKLMTDITLPSNWVPVGALQPGKTSSGSGRYIYPFAGNFDGDGHTVTVAEGGLPLFGYVRYTTIRNLNIYGPQIAGYGLINNFVVDYGPTGNYSNWVSSGGFTANIDNVTIKAGTQTLKAGFLGGFASAANTVSITNCTAEKGVVIGYSKQISTIGSFTGELAGTINNCHSYADVYGASSVGGLAGSKGEAMGVSRIINSSFEGTVTATGNYAGGIYGRGYGSSSAPNTPCVSIQNCYVNAAITGAAKVGGILGAEPACAQCWANGAGYIQNNYFYGSLSSDDPATTGGIVGYMKSLDRYNIISNNFFLENCGADRAIGQAEIIDTTADINEENITHVTTSTYCRNDDPMGADAETLGRSAAESEFADGSITDALNNGINSSHNWVQNGDYPGFGDGSVAYVESLDVTGYKDKYNTLEEFTTEGIKVVAHMSDGTSKEVDLAEVEFSGYINTPGTWSISAVYGGCLKMFSVTVKAATDEDTAEYAENLIKAIGEVTAESEDAIKAARKFYDSMSEKQRELVTNYETLTKAEADLETLKIDTEAAEHVKKLIDQIGKVTLAGSDKIQAARDAYDKLTDTQKKLVANYKVLTTAETKIKALKKEAETVDSLIKAIGKVNTGSGSAIKAARTAYDKLSAEQKKLVKNYNILKAAEKKYAGFVQGVSLNKKSAAMYKNETMTLKAVIKPDKAENKNVTWSSSNKKVASVDKNGKVKALQEGTAVITVTTAEGKFKATCKVTVTSKGQWVQNAKGWWYRYSDGTWPANCRKTIDNTVYAFSADGYMLTGWAKVQGKWSYHKANGAAATGWQAINGKWYYLTPGSGAMAQDWAKVSGKWYYLTPGSGAMAEGWSMIRNTWYYLTPGNGAMAEGWRNIGNTWYYLTPKSGAMAQGWAKISGKWYYLTPGSGAMAQGWKQLGNSWYYLTPGNGAMAANTWIGNYYVNGSGVWTKTR